MEPVPVLEQARSEDLGEVIALYEAVHDKLESGVNWPRWRRGIYPAPRDARAGLDAGTLYVLREQPARTGGRAVTDGPSRRPLPIAATMILNHDQPAAYADIVWVAKTPPERVAAVHTFMVHPAYGRGGYGAMALRAAHALARSRGCLCMRLDTYEGNIPAQSLYEKAGYRNAGRIDLKLTDYGLDEFWVIVYEFALFVVGGDICGKP